MRRIITVLAPAVAISLALAAPGAALAHGARHHKRHHHAKGARVIKLTPVQSGKEATEPGSTAGESIGTVSSYEKEVLTIKLTDGSSTSGKVTPQTRVICVSPTSTSAGSAGWQHGWGENFGWWQHGGGCSEPSSEGGGAEPGASPSPAAHGASGRWGGRGDCFQGKEVDLEKVLVPGAVVDEAELRLTPAGAIWDSVVIDQ